MKLRNYAFSDKVWLNSKYIKTKQNRKLESKFFKPFQVLYLMKKQIYKLKFPRNWKIHDMFHMLLLEQNITWKKQVDKNVTKFNFGNSKEYKIRKIRDNIIYVRKLEAKSLLKLYYLITSKKYFKPENIWKLILAVKHFQKLINSVYKDNSDKPMAISACVDSAMPIALLIVGLPKAIKQKQG